MTCNIPTAPFAPSLRSPREINKKPVILTPQGTELSPQEADLYAHHKPYGFILFRKHCETPQQLQKLIADLKATAGDDCVISVDQEGGRVARLRAPHWPEFPAAANMDDVYQTYLELGDMLYQNGINTNFAPCLDVVPEGGQSDAIGDRCFFHDAAIVGQKGIEAVQAIISAGLIPVIKHMPGHGRAIEDSHYHLPVVKASESELLKDLEAFKIVVDERLSICGMTAHVIFKCWDADKPATLSKTIITDIIRGEIGFQGLLFSDDLAMKALDSYGDMITRVHMALAAGCDIAVPCHTNFDESLEILESF